MEDFLNDLAGKKPQDASRIRGVLQLAAGIGPQGIRNKEKVRKVTGELWEFKAYQVRVLWAYGPNEGSRRTCLLLTGIVKKQTKHKQSDIERATALLADYRSHTA